ncbi:MULTISPECIES: hypothetical protein [Sphingomonas]|uniref:hypothetical protein n=1 Tax=Sphingomonas TaxID=13687 RepID=UPI000DEEC9EE|nr:MULTISPECIES: hypothetical protein [Sphingomonas]
MSKVVRFRSPEQFRQHAVIAVAPERRSIRRTAWRHEDPVLDPTDNVLLQRISDELEFAWRQIDGARGNLSRDSVTAFRHGASLATIDAVGQALGQLAVVLRSADPEAAVGRVLMPDLRGRLQRTGGIL